MRRAEDGGGKRVWPGKLCLGVGGVGGGGVVVVVFPSPPVVLAAEASVSERLPPFLSPLHCTMPPLQQPSKGNTHPHPHTHTKTTTSSHPHGPGASGGGVGLDPRPPSPPPGLASVESGVQKLSGSGIPSVQGMRAITQMAQTCVCVCVCVLLCTMATNNKPSPPPLLSIDDQ